MRTNLFPNPRNLPADSSQSWGQWTCEGTSPTIANSTALWLSPIQSSVLVTWASPVTAYHGVVGMTANLTVGTTYTLSAWVRVPAGSTAVTVAAVGVAVGAPSATNDAWERVSTTFTATAASQFVGITPAASSSTPGTVYISQPLIEVGTTAGSYFDGGYLSGFWNADGSSVLASQAPQRINHIFNPTGTTDTTYIGAYYGSGGAGTLALDSTVSHVGTQSFKMTWTTAPTTYGYLDYYNSLQGAKPGASYTFSAWVCPSVTMNIYALLEAYSGSTDLKASAGHTTTCPAGTWTQVSTTGPAVAGTQFMRPFIIVTAPPAAGTTINFDGLLLEEGSQLLPYFDWSSPNSAQVGMTPNVQLGQAVSPYACSMSQSMPNLNPNLPELQIVGWPTRTTYGTPAPVPMDGSGPTTPSNAPLVLSDRVTQVSTSRGRQYELDTDQTGSLGLKLDDSDGAVSNLLRPYNNVQVQAMWQGVAYDIWTGFASVIPSQSENARNSWSNLTGVDGLDVLSNRALRPIQQEAILADNPERFFPLNDAEGSTGALDITATSLPGSGQAAPLVHAVENSNGALGSGSCISTFGAQTIAVNGDSAWSLSNLSPFGAILQEAQIQVCGPIAGTDYQLDLTKPWAVEITSSLSSPDGGIYFDAGPLFDIRDGNGAEKITAAWAPDAVAQPQTSTTGHIIVFIGTSGYVMSQEFTVAQAAAGAHVVLMSDGAGNYSLMVNGVTQDYAYAENLGMGARIGIGCSYGPAMGQSYSFHPTTVTTLQNFAVYGSQLGVPSSDALYGHYLAYLAYPLETAQTRIQRVLEWSGVPSMATWPDASDSVQLAVMQDTTETSALSVIQQASQSVLSRLIIDESGAPLYQDRAHGLTDQSPVVVFGSDEAAGEIPYTGMPTVAIDPQHLFNDVTVTQDSGTTTRFADQDSVAQYFQHVLQASSSVYSAADAGFMASYLVGRYGEPPSRVSTLSVDLAANPNITNAILGLRIGNHVQLNHRTQAGVIALDLTIDQVSHAIQADSWVVSFELTPLYRYWVAASGRAQLTAAVPVGATSVTIGPMQDAAWNPVEGSIAVGSAMVLSPDTPSAEALAVTAVTSNTPGAAGYSSATVTFATPTTQVHAVGDELCDAPPSVTVEDGFGGSLPTPLVKLQTPSGFVNQSFFYDATTNQYYGANAKGGTLTTTQDMIVSRYDASGNLLDSATCTGGGHGASITVEYDGSNNPWLWFQWGVEDMPLVKWKYQPGTWDESSATPVADFGTGTGRVTMFNIDQVNDFIGVYTYIHDAHTETFDLRRLSDYNAGRDNLLASVTMTSADRLESFQGFCIDADKYLYVARGGDFPNSTATLYRYRWGAGDVIDAKLDTSKVPAETGTHGPGDTYAEAEGVQMLRDSSGTNVIFGVTTDSTPGQRWNWVYKVNIPQNTTPSAALQFEPTEWDSFSMLDSTTIPQW